MLETIIDGLAQKVVSHSYKRKPDSDNVKSGYQFARF